MVRTYDIPKTPKSTVTPALPLTSQLQDEPPTDHYVLIEESVVVLEAPNKKPHTEKLTTLSDVTHETPVVTTDGNDAPSVTLESAWNESVTEVQ